MSSQTANSLSVITGRSPLKVSDDGDDDEDDDDDDG